jgi:hypothetical protein
MVLTLLPLGTPGSVPQIDPTDPALTERARIWLTHRLAMEEFWTLEDAWLPWSKGVPIEVTMEVTAAGNHRLMVEPPDPKERLRNPGIQVVLRRDPVAPGGWTKRGRDESSVRARQTFTITIPLNWEPNVWPLPERPWLEEFNRLRLAGYLWLEGLASGEKAEVWLTDGDPVWYGALAVTDPPRYIVRMPSAWEGENVPRMEELIGYAKQNPYAPYWWRHRRLIQQGGRLIVEPRRWFAGQWPVVEEYRDVVVQRVMKYGRKILLKRPPGLPNRPTR